VAGKAFWVSLIVLALLILLVRFLGGEHTLYILRGLYSSNRARRVIVLSILLVCFCIWALSSKPRGR
jgi:hypothetical protein